MSGEPYVVDLFAGTGSATDAFVEAGWGRTRVELSPKFEAEIHADVMEVTPEDLWRGYPPTFVWASPPCTTFSVQSLAHHWRTEYDCRRCGAPIEVVGSGRVEHWGCDRPVKVRASVTRVPKTEAAVRGVIMVRRTLQLIRDLQPTWWVMENPVAMLRTHAVVDGLERRTITHCQYGDPRRQKPTDLWGDFPPGFEARACKQGAACHVAAPRGSRTGTQGLGRAAAAMLPPDLGRELLAACRRGMTP